MSWTKGRHDDHDVVVIEVHVRRDANGRVLSAHAPQDTADQETLLSWPSGGMEQVGFALLAEATRREAMIDVLLQASKDPAFLPWWRSAGEAERDAALAKMARGMRASMDEVVRRIADGALRAALEQVTLSDE